MACCPVNSHPFLESGDYHPIGKVENVKGLDIYFVGSGEKCILWNYDIFGFNAGRTRELCDLLSKKGYFVILPDYYKGTSTSVSDPGLIEFIKKHNYNDLLKDMIDDIVLPFARNHGAKVFGSVGTCWGTYVVLYVSSFEGFVGGVSLHPSHSKVCAVVGDSEESLLKNVKCRQLFLSAGNEHENCLPGGLGEQVLKENLSITVFEDMIHGWTTRGDLSSESVKRDLNKSFSSLIDFFDTCFKN